MITGRRGTWIGLVAAFVVLLTSVGLATAYAGNGDRWPWTPAPPDATGPAPYGGYGGMMGGDQRGWNDNGDPGNGWQDGYGNGGMMERDRDWSGQPTAVTLTQAQAVADSWLASNRPGATVDQGRRAPVGYMFTVTENNQSVGVVMVSDDNGAAWWRATRSTASPSPTSRP